MVEFIWRQFPPRYAHTPDDLKRLVGALKFQSLLETKQPVVDIDRLASRPFCLCPLGPRSADVIFNLLLNFRKSAETEHDISQILAGFRFQSWGDVRRLDDPL